MDSSKIINPISYALFASITVYLFVYIHQRVPEPYMDEYFHFHQAANYCSGNYKHVNIIRHSFVFFQNSFFLFTYLSGIQVLQHHRAYIL
jgi:hypothetical protein